MSVLNICFWNANGVNQHKLELARFLTEYAIDVMLLSETHLTDKYNFYIPGFIFYSTNHPDGKAHGGTGILLRNRLKHCVLQPYATNYLQATSVTLNNYGKELNLSAIYCPPKFKITENQFKEFFDNLGDRFIAGGDYNAKHVYWGSRLINPKGRQLYNTIISKRNNLDCISPGQPTYWPTDRKKIPDLIDFAVSRKIDRQLVSAVTVAELSSDHSPVLIKIYERPKIVAQESRLTNRETNWLKYKKYTSSHININPILNCENDIEDYINELNNVLVSAATIATQNSKKPITCPKILTNTEIEKLVKNKRRLRREWQEYRSPAAKLRLKAAERKLKSALKQAEDHNTKAYIEKLAPNSAKKYSLWKAQKKFKPPIEVNMPIRDPNGNWTRSNEEKANCFAKHLSNVFQPNDATNNFILPEVVVNGQENQVAIKISSLEVVDAIQKLNPKKSPGHDLITPKMLIELPRVAQALLSELFNAILKLNYFPNAWKMSQILMIAKPGKDHTQASSYRPISLLPSLSKLFEKILLSKISPFLHRNNVIPDHQFGFREKHSTIEQVNRITNEIRKAFELKEYCCAIFLDVAQAFDKVWHKGLLYKIHKALPVQFYMILKSYLTNRQFTIKQSEFISEEYPVKAGVPQGSVLGPILYIIYTADIPLNRKVQTSTFADDTAVLCRDKCPKRAAKTISDHLLLIEEWLENWRIKVNEQKCKHVTFTLRPQSCPAIRLNGINIPQVNDVTYLGIHLDRRLTWKRHIEAKILHMKLKAASLNWLLNKNSGLKLDYKVLIYNAVLKPIWMYGIQLWGTTCATNIDKIQRFQSKILRALTGAPWYVRNVNIHKDLGILLVKPEIERSRTKYFIKLRNHPNPLANALCNPTRNSRLQRRDVPAF